MSENTMSERDDNVNKVIRNHVAWSMGAGLIPVPIADFFAVSAIQLDMVRQMCKLYEVPFKENEGKAAITSLTSSGLARLGARAIIKFVPGIGSVVGGITVAVMSGASTFALGEAFKKHFETGGTFLDFDLERLRKVYNDGFEKGKEYAKEIKRQQEDEKEKIKKEVENEVAEKVKAEAQAAAEAAAASKPTEFDASSSIEKLREIAKLKEDGIITDEEFETMKRRIINS
ncbi:MAG: DUF697 domain-containing protein [Bacteroidota bacterium]